MAVNRSQMLIESIAPKINWIPNAIGGEKASITTRLNLNLVVHVNPVRGKEDKAYTWMIGRDGDRFISSGDAKSKDIAKREAIRYIHGMEQRGIA